MVKPPSPRAPVVDPSMAAPIDVPQALVNLSNTLSDFSDRLDTFIKSSGNPFTPAMRQLRDLDTHLAADADLIGRLAVDSMTNEVSAAISNLGAQVITAKQTLDRINNVKLALSVVAAVFSAAAAISTGNPLASAQSVLSLAQVVSSAVKGSGSSGD
jgi:hypothetical protein